MTHLFNVGVNTSPGRSIEWVFIKDADGFARMQFGTYGAVRSPATRYDASNLSATPIVTSANAYFGPTQVGATFEVPFTGTGIIFNHHINSVGGAWHVSIDGGPPIFVSANRAHPSNINNPSSIGRKRLADSLPFGPHVAIWTFIGADPDYPPTGAVRGWFKLKGSTGLEEQHTADILTGAEMGLGGISSLMGIGIFEFAIEARANSSTISRRWVPAHSTDTGAISVLSQSMTVDGESVDINTIGTTSEVEISACEITQTYLARNAFEPTPDLWEGVLITRFDKVRGLSYDHQMTFLVDVDISVGYTAMASCFRDTITGGRIASDYEQSNGYRVDLTKARPTGGENIRHLAGLPRSARWVGPDFEIAIETPDTESALSLGSAFGNERTVLLTERPDGSNKLYWQTFGRNVVVPQGASVRTQHSIWAATWAGV